MIFWLVCFVVCVASAENVTDTSTIPNTEASQVNTETGTGDFKIIKVINIPENGSEASVFTSHREKRNGVLGLYLNPHDPLSRLAAVWWAKFFEKPFHALKPHHHHHHPNGTFPTFEPPPPSLSDMINGATSKPAAPPIPTADKPGPTNAPEIPGGEGDPVEGQTFSPLNPQIPGFPGQNPNLNPNFPGQNPNYPIYPQYPNQPQAQFPQQPGQRPQGNPGQGSPFFPQNNQNGFPGFNQNQPNPYPQGQGQGQPNFNQPPNFQNPQQQQRPPGQFPGGPGQQQQPGQQPGQQLQPGQGQPGGNFPNPGQRPPGNFPGQQRPPVSNRVEPVPIPSSNNNNIDQLSSSYDLNQQSQQSQPIFPILIPNQSPISSPNQNQNQNQITSSSASSFPFLNPEALLLSNPGNLNRFPNPFNLTNNYHISYILYTKNGNEPLQLPQNSNNLNNNNNNKPEVKSSISQSVPKESPTLFDLFKLLSLPTPEPTSTRTTIDTTKIATMDGDVTNSELNSQQQQRENEGKSENHQKSSQNQNPEELQQKVSLVSEVVPSLLEEAAKSKLQVFPSHSMLFVFPGNFPLLPVTGNYSLSKGSFSHFDPTASLATKPSDNSDSSVSPEKTSRTGDRHKASGKCATDNTICSLRVKK